jgi:hypothetical protein
MDHCNGATMSDLFLIATTLLLVVVLGGLWVFSAKPLGRRAVLLFVVWFGYGAGVGTSGILANTSSTPPGIFWMVVALVPFMVTLVRTKWAKATANHIPLVWLIGLQVFRLPLELVLHELYRDGMLPQVLTYEGLNFDIVMGASAPLVAWLAVTQKMPVIAVKVWNIVGILMVINVAARGIRFAIQGVPPEIREFAIAAFPYTLIPSFLVPLALGLHVMTLRKLSGPL